MADWHAEAREIREASHYEHLRILVWGPGDPGTSAPPEKQKAYRKRLQIKDVLRNRFPRAEVNFSEDLEMVQIATGIIGQLRKEALQARTADLILMLAISRGAELELDHFVPTYPWFREKVYVLLPQQFIPPQGLVKEVFDHLKPDQVVGFSNDDFISCVVATEKSVSITEGVAMDKYLRR
ncbi:MAG: hypothetical protein WCP58_10420 [bacterium]